MIRIYVYTFIHRICLSLVHSTFFLVSASDTSNVDVCFMHAYKTVDRKSSLRVYGIVIERTNEIYSSAMDNVIQLYASWMPTTNEPLSHTARRNTHTHARMLSNALTPMHFTKHTHTHGRTHAHTHTRMTHSEREKDIETLSQ